MISTDDGDDMGEGPVNIRPGQSTRFDSTLDSSPNFKPSERGLVSAYSKPSLDGYYHHLFNFRDPHATLYDQAARIAAMPSVFLAAFFPWKCGKEKASSTNSPQNKPIRILDPNIGRVCTQNDDCTNTSNPLHCVEGICVPECDHLPRSLIIPCEPGEEIGECRIGTREIKCVKDVIKVGECEGKVIPRPEICDGKDNDCNRQTDEAVELTDRECPPGKTRQRSCSSDWSPCVGDECKEEDIRGETCGLEEGECQAGEETFVCQEGVFVSDGNGCVGGVEPAVERCDGLDNDCDGSTDEGLGQTTCGVGVCQHAADNCVRGALKVCNPMEGALVEVACNNVDEDCNGRDFLGTDNDRDGYKLEGGACGQADCNDSNRGIHPGAPVGSCYADNNCDGVITFVKRGDERRVSNLLVGDINPSLAWNGTNFGVSWVAQSDYGVHFSRISAEGILRGGLRVGSSNGLTFGSSSLIAAGSLYGLAWVDYADPGLWGDDNVYFATVEGSAIRTGPTKITEDWGCEYPSLAWSGSQFGIVWQGSPGGSGFGIQFVVINDRGERVINQTTLASALTYIKPRILWTGSEFAITWLERDRGTLATHFEKRSALGERTAGPRRIVNGDSQIVWNGMEFGAIIPSREGIDFFRLDSQGNRIGLPRRVSNDARSNNADLVWTGAGYGVAWNKAISSERGVGDEIFFAGLGEDGTRIGDPVQVTSDPADSMFPKLAWTEREFGVAWMDNRDGNLEIYFTRLGCQ